jgi:hypothetical protein
MVLPKKSQLGTPNPDPWYGFTEINCSISKIIPIWMARYGNHNKKPHHNKKRYKYI